MGSSASKAARTAGGTVRRYPSRASPPNDTSRTASAPSTRPNVENPTGPTVRHQTEFNGSRDDAIRRDASDPDLAFNYRLSQLGPVQPSPTLSHSSTFNPAARLPASTPRSSPLSQPQSQRPGPAFQPSASAPSQTIFPSPASNPAVTLLTARSRLAHEAEEEFENLGRNGSPGRSFLDVVTIRQVLMMRDGHGKGAEEIERALGLRKGLVGKLGPRGVYSGAGA